MTDAPAPITIIGSYVSPYVRKTLACMALKGIDDYRIDPITPFFGNDEFTRLSPLRRIPVLIQGDLVLSDSSVICAWLDEEYADRAPLLPEGPALRARARWYEEFADSRMGDVFIWDYFFQKFVHPLVWGEPGDQGRIDQAESSGIPGILDFLESEVPTEEFLFGTIGLADVAIAAFFPNLRYAGYEPDPDRWPRTSNYLRRCLVHPAFARLLPFEEAQVAVSPARRREALLAAGAPLTEFTMGEREPRRGVMTL